MPLEEFERSKLSVHAVAYIAEIESRLALHVDQKTDGWQCGNGWPIGTCPCDHCEGHRLDLAALGRPVPDITNGLDE